jgi:uncharacterized protein YejL (UPF0352 family)
MHPHRWSTSLSLVEVGEVVPELINTRLAAAALEDLGRQLGLQ